MHSACQHHSFNDSFHESLHASPVAGSTGAGSGTQFSQICVLALLWHGFRFLKLNLGQDRLQSKVGIALLVCNLIESKIIIALVLCNLIEKRHRLKLLVTDILHHG